jgi:prepilin-type N-terminal cleavage/methylation domain-containing protein
MLRSRCLGKWRGFTLVELLLVIGIIAILFGFLAVALRKAHDAGTRTHCQNNLRQIGLAAHNCNDSRGKLPPTMGWFNDYEEGSLPLGNSYGPTLWQILPYVESDTVFRDCYQEDWPRPPALPTSRGRRPASISRHTPARRTRPSPLTAGPPRGATSPIIRYSRKAGRASRRPSRTAPRTPSYSPNGWPNAAPLPSTGCGGTVRLTRAVRRSPTARPGRGPNF